MALDLAGKLQLGLGAGQLLYGAFMNTGSRPTMPIPGAVEESTELARREAMATVRPGNEYAISQIKQGEGRAINALNRGLKSSSQILAGVSQVNQNTNRALADNANQNTLYKFNASRNLQNALARLGQYQQQQFMTNELQPYLERSQTKNMLVGAGIQNLGQFANAQSEMAMFDKLYGGMNDVSATSGTPKRFDFGVNANAMDAPLFKLPSSTRKPMVGLPQEQVGGYEDFKYRFNQ